MQVLRSSTGTPSDRLALCTLPHLAVLTPHCALQQIACLTSQLALILLSVWFQEEDLNCVRERWSEALIKRREYLDEQIKKIINKHGEESGTG